MLIQHGLVEFGLLFGDTDPDDQAAEDYDDEEGSMMIETTQSVTKQKKKEYNVSIKDITNYKLNDLNINEELIKNELKKITQNQKNIDILYKNIKEIDNQKDTLFFLNNYFIYKTQVNIKEFQTNIKNKNIGFNNSFWDQERNQIKDEVLKIKAPVEVKKGLFTCNKCKMSITKSYAVQLRRADEPPTVFIHCMNKDCLHKWREN
jgi:DNA-directed RNA polymerase subunit M/transcription elongation factor TFIIS